MHAGMRKGKLIQHQRLGNEKGKRIVIFAYFKVSRT
jgi:hypothetical protein